MSHDSLAEWGEIGIFHAWRALAFSEIDPFACASDRSNFQRQRDEICSEM